MKIKKENGVTLVALIVSIIVLIILAAVSLIIVLDDNVIEVTTNGAEKYDQKQHEEKIIMESIGDKVDSILEVIQENDN